MSWWRKQTTKPKLATLGEQGESWAAEEYKKRGFTVIAKNEFYKRGKRRGEIDIVARNTHELVFVEVKTRTAGTSKFGKPAESVNIFKQLKLLKAVKLFLLNHPELSGLKPRIDVCAIVVQPLRLSRSGAAGLDKAPYSVTILENVVEDWN